MKFSVKPFQSDATQLRYVKCVAIIPKSAKLGVPRRFQKTWKVRTVAPEFAAEEMKPSFLKVAKRWEQQTLERIKNGEQPDLKQEKMLNAKGQQ